MDEPTLTQELQQQELKQQAQLEQRELQALESISAPNGGHYNEFERESAFLITTLYQRTQEMESRLHVLEEYVERDKPSPSTAPPSAYDTILEKVGQWLTAHPSNIKNLEAPLNLDTVELDEKYIAALNLAREIPLQMVAQLPRRCHSYVWFQAREIQARTHYSVLHICGVPDHKEIIEKCRELAEMVIRYAGEVK